MSFVRGVIFDIDGTLVDSNDAHAHAWVAALAEAGHDVAFDRVRRLIGKGGDKVLPELTGLDHEGAEGKQISTRRGEIFMTNYVPQLKPFPKTRDLLMRLHAEGCKLIVATSAPQQELKALLAITGAAELFEERTTSDDAAHSKPDPDIVMVALRRSGLPASAVVMIGDTPYDIEAAGKAGVHAIGLRSGGWQDADLRDATATFASPADLLAQIEHSPLAA